MDFSMVYSRRLINSRKLCPVPVMRFPISWGVKLFQGYKQYEPFKNEPKMLINIIILRNKMYYRQNKRLTDYGLL